jgi:hypothetical protein
MKRTVAALVMTGGLILSGGGRAQTPKVVILPNVKLLRCQAASCSQLLPDRPAGFDAIFPWQVSTDIDHGAVIGLTALYDKPTSFDVIKTAIDEKYGKWALPWSSKGPVELWRIEPEKFVIQLGTTDSGMTQVIYLVFGAKHDTVASTPCGKTD